jgi:hypothetical protein
MARRHHLADEAGVERNLPAAEPVESRGEG